MKNSECYKYLKNYFTVLQKFMVIPITMVGRVKGLFKSKLHITMVDGFDNGTRVGS